MLSLFDALLSQTWQISSKINDIIAQLKYTFFADSYK